MTIATRLARLAQTAIIFTRFAGIIPIAFDIVITLIGIGVKIVKTKATTAIDTTIGIMIPGTTIITITTSRVAFSISATRRYTTLIITACRPCTAWIAGTASFIIQRWAITTTYVVTYQVCLIPGTDGGIRWAFA